MKLRWYGHACFLITSSEGTRLITDPFDETVGYSLPDTEADIVTVSHDHFDHNYVKAVRGKPQVIRGPVDTELRDIHIKGVSTYHDDVKGAKRGKNTVYVFELDGMRLCHLGDLGHTLTDADVRSIGRVDILLVPVGGTYTIDADGAKAVVKQLDPQVAIPMHYKTPAIGFPIADERLFLAEFDDIARPDALTVEFTRQTLPEARRIYVLKYQ